MNRLTDDQVSTLRKSLEHIIHHPETWNQESWGRRVSATGGDATACGTAYCLAGHVAVTVDGLYPVFYAEGGFMDYVTASPPTTEFHDSATVAADQLLEVSSYASARLGLDRDAADALFAGDNSLRRLVELAWYYSGGCVDLFDALPTDAAAVARDRQAELRAAAATEVLFRVAADHAHHCEHDNCRRRSGASTLAAHLEALYPTRVATDGDDLIGTDW